MKLNIKALGLTAGIFWGASILFVALVGMMMEGFGKEFLEVVASIYPGYDATGGIGQAMIGTGYGLVDGFIGGAIFAWVYNLFAKD